MPNVQTPRRGRALFGGRAIGQKPGKAASATTMSGMPAGQGMVGTAGNPSPSVPGVTTGLKRSPPTPNSGGILQKTGGPAQTIAPDADYKGPVATGFDDDPANPGSWKPETNRPQQTERANPLVNGGGTPQVEGTSTPVAAPTLDAGKALGYSHRGGRTPAGKDRMVGTPGPDLGAFNKPDSDSAMSDHIDSLASTRDSVQNDLSAPRNLFGTNKSQSKPGAATGLTRVSAPRGPGDEEDENA